MSCLQNDIYLERKYEEGIEQGMSEEEAEKYAKDCLENGGEA